MRPDLRKPVRAGWATLGGAAFVVAIALWVLSGDDVGAELEKAKKDYAQKQGKQDFRHLLNAQAQANDELARTIGQLKRDTGMSRNPYFVVPPGTQQKGYLWRDRFIWVQDQLRKRAKDRSVQINDDLGFGQYAEGVAPEDMADDLLTALQLVQKTATIALSTKDTNFVRISVQPQLKSVLAGAKERPLLREFPVTLTVVGSDKDILWVLHRFSLVEPQTAAAQQNADATVEKAEDDAIAKLFPKLSRPSGMRELTPEEVQLLDGYVIKRDYPLGAHRPYRCYEAEAADSGRDGGGRRRLTRPQSRCSGTNTATPSSPFQSPPRHSHAPATDVHAGGGPASASSIDSATVTASTSRRAIGSTDTTIEGAPARLRRVLGPRRACVVSEDERDVPVAR